MPPSTRLTLDTQPMQVMPLTGITVVSMMFSLVVIGDW
jgi:hypothetical protein